MLRLLGYSAVWFVTAACCLILPVESPRAETPVSILISDSLTSTQRTLHGIRKVLTQSHQDVRCHTILIDYGLNSKPRLVDSVRVLNPAVILTVGSPATSFAKEHFHQTPIVFAGVRYPVLSGFVESIASPGRNITGASLDIPTDVQFKYFKMIIPDMRQVGVMYTKGTASLIAQARVIAQDMGLRLMPVLVESNKDVPEALDSLARVVDGIWSVADPELFDPQTTRYLLLNTLRKGVPFMGFSQYVVESGALFALDFDYKAVGFQAGEIAGRVLNGESPDRIRVSTADVIWFHYNEKTARHINVTIPDDLVAVAKEVYR